MKTTTQTNKLVGSKVLIDWPVRWRGAGPDGAQDRAKAIAEKDEQYFGQTGEIVAYHYGSDNGKDLMVKLEPTGQIINLYIGAVTITAGPENESAKTDALLKQILVELQKSNALFCHINGINLEVI